MEIKEVLRHFAIGMEELPEESFIEINNNKNTREVYGIERIMRGRTNKKVRIVIDYDADFPKLILRVFARDNHLEEMGD